MLGHRFFAIPYPTMASRNNHGDRPLLWVVAASPRLFVSMNSAHSCLLVRDLVPIHPPNVAFFVVANVVVAQLLLRTRRLFGGEGVVDSRTGPLFLNTLVKKRRNVVTFVRL